MMYVFKLCLRLFVFEESLCQKQPVGVQDAFSFVSAECGNDNDNRTFYYVNVFDTFFLEYSESLS